MQGMWVEFLFKELRSHSQRGTEPVCRKCSGAHATARAKPTTKITSAATKIQRSKKSINSKKRKRDFPGGPKTKTLHSQCRGPGFNPWSGN